MKRLLAVVAAVVACNRPHDVRVLLGPDERTLSVGFRCLDKATDQALFARAVAAKHFALVIDLMTIRGDTFPGCRTEELVGVCAESTCRVLPNRYCVDVDLTSAAIDISDPMKALEQFSAYLRGKDPVISPDAPDVPTIVRAVATTQTCAALGDGELDVAAVVGCAHSCPLLLDEVDESISLSLDTFDAYCEATVDYCAAFPGNTL